MGQHPAAVSKSMGGNAKLKDSLLLMDDGPREHAVVYPAGQKIPGE